MLVSPQGYEAGRGNESAPLVNKQNNASSWAISSDRSCCRGDWFAVMSRDQHASFLTEDVYPSTITSPPKTTYCMKCLFEKNTFTHFCLCLYLLQGSLHDMSVFHPGRPCDSHTSVVFFSSTLHRGLDSLSTFSPFIDCFVLTSRISWPAPL